MGTGNQSVTALLAEWNAGDAAAMDQLIPLVYEELRRVAALCLRSDPAATMRATALVHEFYLRTPGLQDWSWNSRAHFVGTAARVMRHMLIDRARRRGAAKRGAGFERASATEIPIEDPLMDVLAVDEALQRLARQYPRHAQVVELLFFGGLTAEEAAEVLSASGTAVSPRTVERDWRFARSWLHHELAN